MRTFILREPGIVERACAYLRSLVGVYEVIVKPHEPRRNSEQNARLHAHLSDIAKQCKWAGQKLDVDDWKRLFCAALYGQKVLPSLDGEGFTVIVKRTRDMTKKECSELIDFVQAWGAERGVVFGDMLEAA